MHPHPHSTTEAPFYEEWLDLCTRAFCRRRGLSYADHGEDIKQNVRVELWLGEFGFRAGTDPGHPKRAILKAVNKYTQRATRRTRHPLWSQAPAFANVELEEKTLPCSSSIVERVYAEMRANLKEDEMRVLVLDGARKADLSAEEMNQITDITGVTIMKNEILDGPASAKDRQKVKRVRDKVMPFIRPLLWALAVTTLLTIWAQSFAKDHQGANQSRQIQTASLDLKTHQG